MAHHKMAHLLDADTTSLAFRGHAKIRARLLRTPPEAVWLSSIAAEELTQGALARLSRARSRLTPEMEVVSRFFVDILVYLTSFSILPYTNDAERLFRSWPASVKRVGTNDCRIAASAIVHGYTVVTCNGKDFSRIPGVRFEDWSA